MKKETGNAILRKKRQKNEKETQEKKHTRESKYMRHKSKA